MSTPRWPNIERLLVSWLAARTGRPVYTETPTDLSAHLPAYQVERAGGYDAAETSRVIQVQVDVVAATRPEMWAAVQDAETAMAALAASGDERWYVDAVANTFAFAVEPYANPQIRRATATYALTMRPSAP